MDDQRDEPTTGDQEETRTAKGGSHSRGGEPPMKRLGDFDLLNEIGRGGMGIVYEARQISLNRRVALKILPPGLGLTDTAVQRFEREARAAAKLHHTNIVPVHAIGEEVGHHYYAMELIEGLSLAQILSDIQQEETQTRKEETITRLFAREQGEQGAPEEIKTAPSSSKPSATAAGRRWFDIVARRLADVADALDHAHGRGVVHRDIKPANLLLSPEGRLCITDFGLARMAQEPGMTTTGAFLGTPSYMSPEQARGHKVDHRSDIYSLGVVLYEMLTLQRPFTGESWEKIVQSILTRDPEAPRHINPRVPVDLETICLKAMEKDPDRRYQTAGEFAEDLRQYMQHGLIKARRAGIARRTWKSIRRHPVASTAVLAAVLLTAIAGFSWAAIRRAGIPALITEARLLLSQGEFRDALARAEQALAADPDNLDARLLHARIDVHLGHNWPAIEEAREILNEDPDRWEAHVVIATAAKSGNVWSIPVDEHIAAVEAGAPATADAFFLRGWVADIDARDREAVEWLGKALELDPGHALALETRAEAHAELKNLPAALADAERLVAARPLSAMGHRTKAYVYHQLHDEQRALEACARAIELDPEDPFNYYMRGRIYRDLERINETIADLTRAIELDPDVGRFYELRAAVRYLRNHEWDLALADARRGLELHHYSFGTCNMLFLAQWSAGRKDEARAALEELNTRAEGWVERAGLRTLHEMWGVYYYQIEDYESALKECDRAVELGRNEMRVLSWRAKVRQEVEGQAGVEEDCDLMAGLDLPDEPVKFFSRARRMRDTCGRTGQALADFSRAIELAPNWSEPYLERGLLYRDKKRFAEALSDLNRAVELTPSYPEAIYNHGRMLATLERFDEALADFDRCVELGGEDTDLRRDQATALLRLGRESEALRVLDEFLEKHPESWWGHLNRAMALHSLGRIDEAIESDGRAVELQPDFPFAYWLRAAHASVKQGMCDRIEADVAKLKELARGGGSSDDNAYLMVVNIYRACPEFYDAAKALELAREGAEFDTGNAFGQSAYGIALHRNGEYAAARERLLAAQELSLHDEPPILFFLAMTSFKLGEPARAREYYDRATARVLATYPKNPLYILVAEEAAEVLGIEE